MSPRMNSCSTLRVIAMFIVDASRLPSMHTSEMSVFFISFTVAWLRENSGFWVNQVEAHTI